MSSVDHFARPKAIGEDVESLVVDALPLESAEETESHHDAVSTAPIGWSEASAAPFSVRFLDCMGVNADEFVEVKAVARRISNGGGRKIRGRFDLKGRDEGQHAHLVDSRGYYALTIYEPLANDTREVLSVTFVPAVSLDEHLDGRWFEVDRHEKTRAQFGWADVVNPELIEAAVDRLDLDDGPDEPVENGSTGRHLFEVVALVADRLAGDSVGDAAEVVDVVDSVLEVTNATRDDVERAVDTAKARGAVYHPREGRLRYTGYLTAATDGGEGE